MHSYICENIFAWFIPLNFLFSKENDGTPLGGADFAALFKRF